MATLLRNAPRKRLAGRALVVVGIALAILLLVAGLAVLLIDQITASAVESGGTYALGVPTELESADIGLVDGRVELANLTIANPEGFESPRFFGLSGAAFQVPPKQLLEDQVVIDEVVLDGIEISLERAGGRTNYGVILENLKRISPDTKESQKDEEEEKAGKTFVIKRLQLRNVRARIDLTPPIPAQTVTIGSIELEDVGNEGSGLEMAELFGRIITEVLASVIESAGDLIPADLRRPLEKVLGELGDFSGGALDHMSRGLGKAGEGIKDGAADIGKGIKKLFD